MACVDFLFPGRLPHVFVGLVLEISLPAAALGIKNDLDLRVILVVPAAAPEAESVLETLAELGSEDLPLLFAVSQVQVVAVDEGEAFLVPGGAYEHVPEEGQHDGQQQAGQQMRVIVGMAPGSKCARCWIVRPDVDVGWPCGSGQARVELGVQGNLNCRVCERTQRDTSIEKRGSDSVLCCLRNAIPTEIATQSLFVSYFLRALQEDLCGRCHDAVQDFQ